MIQMCEMRLYALEAIDYRCLFCRLFFDRWLQNFQRPDTSDIGRFKSSSGWKASGCSSNRNFESTRMVDGQTNDNPEEGMKFIYCRSLVVTSILRCGRSISSQSSSSFQKTKNNISTCSWISPFVFRCSKNGSTLYKMSKRCCRSNLWSMRCQHALWSLSLKDVALTSTLMRGRKTTWFLRGCQYISICKTPQSCGGIFSCTHPWIWG